MRTNATTKLADIEHSAQEVAKTTQDSALLMMDYTVRAQELNMKLLEKTEEQADAFEKLLLGLCDSVFRGMPLAFLQDALQTLEQRPIPNGGLR